jgi:hypothetical protein
MEERIMKTLFAMATTGTLLLSGIASAREFPVYELSGFPISPDEISIMGATVNLKEQSPGTSLTMDGMPASPVQILVLTPHQRAPEERGVRSDRQAHPDVHVQALRSHRGG